MGDGQHRTKCDCPDGTMYCERHGVHKTKEMIAKCRSDPHLFMTWESGIGPGQIGDTSAAMFNADYPCALRGKVIDTISCGFCPDSTVPVPVLECSMHGRCSVIPSGDKTIEHVNLRSCMRCNDRIGPVCFQAPSHEETDYPVTAAVVLASCCRSLSELGSKLALDTCNGEPLFSCAVPTPPMMDSFGLTGGHDGPYAKFFEDDSIEYGLKHECLMAFRYKENPAKTLSENSFMASKFQREVMRLFPNHFAANAQCSSKFHSEILAHLTPRDCGIAFYSPVPQSNTSRAFLVCDEAELAKGNQWDRIALYDRSYMVVTDDWRELLALRGFGVWSPLVLFTGRLYGQSWEQLSIMDGWDRVVFLGERSVDEIRSTATAINDMA